MSKRLEPKAALSTENCDSLMHRNGQDIFFLVSLGGGRGASSWTSLHVADNTDALQDLLFHKKRALTSVGSPSHLGAPRDTDFVTQPLQSGQSCEIRMNFASKFYMYIVHVRASEV